MFKDLPDNKIILDSIKNKGYFSIESFLDNEAIKEIEDNTTKNRHSLNKNCQGGIYYETQYYFMNLLAESQKCYEFCTSNFVIKLCKDYLGDIFRLRALRYYETMSGHNMKWHTDNKIDKKLIKFKGLIFIIYISDVYEGEFQFIEGSHRFNNDYNSPEYKNVDIEAKYSNLIKSFKMPKGSLVIYDAAGIHRAKPYKKNNFTRKSLFFQIDATHENSENILVNTKFLKNTNKDIENLLGFGKDSSYSHYPKTNLNKLPINSVVLKSLINWLLYRSLRFLLRTEPYKLKDLFKKKVLKK